MGTRELVVRLTVVFVNLCVMAIGFFWAYRVVRKKFPELPKAKAVAHVVLVVAIFGVLIFLFRSIAK